MAGLRYIFLLKIFYSWKQTIIYNYFVGYFNLTFCIIDLCSVIELILNKISIRTLLIGMRILSKEEYLDFKEKFNQLAESEDRV